MLGALVQLNYFDPPLKGAKLMKRVVKGTLSVASVVSAAMLGASAVPQWVAKAAECSDIIIVADDDPCTSDSCELIGELDTWCIYECTHENICCW